MKQYFLVAAAVALASQAPTLAEVVSLKSGKPVNGYYWEKVQTETGRQQVVCRSTKDRKKYAYIGKCYEAGAVKP